MRRIITAKAEGVLNKPFLEFIKSVDDLRNSIRVSVKGKIVAVS